MQERTHKQLHLPLPRVTMRTEAALQLGFCALCVMLAILGEGMYVFCVSIAFHCNITIYWVPLF